MHRSTIFFTLCAVVAVTIATEQNLLCDVPRCRMACRYGYKLGKDGCAICSCKKEPLLCDTPRCRMACPHGYKLDKDGCATCACKMGPCEDGEVPLADYFCGRGPSRRDCPESHKCIIVPNDAYAVCCPSRH